MSNLCIFNYCEHIKVPPITNLKSGVFADTRNRFHTNSFIFLKQINDDINALASFGSREDKEMMLANIKYHMLEVLLKKELFCSITREFKLYYNFMKNQITFAMS